jgi:hypothetical protein
MRDRIVNDSTEYVIACYSRGRLFSEHKTAKGAKKKLNKYFCLDLDDYAIYTRQEWELNFAPDPPNKLYPLRGPLGPVRPSGS